MSVCLLELSKYTNTLGNRNSCGVSTAFQKPVSELRAIHFVSDGWSPSPGKGDKHAGFDT